ncbi:MULTISPECIES: MgtC/SapB family protein [unclassified Sporolactobacillus]|uniref:MgtC/SapB family protein n=1 Tax=unclassified Sporolactobacillus TaxID=2628533 RepID=UPI0023689366|nr:MgtC/SapB family protein [Sporolactobacillus sp. CQH2019]MDD9150839.1 MgtC/SapB family protein [Sporolactobacillus sp. CQH2019]
MDLEFILRLGVAGILGALIGIDREIRSKDAGIRTHFLVSLGSALIMVVSQYGFQYIIHEKDVVLDPSRVAAQVVSGIGFIGAGTIIVQKKFVHGLTTAAGIWTTAGIGLTIGAGMYWVGIGATVLTLIGLELSNIFFKSLRSNAIYFKILSKSKEPLNQVLTLFDQDTILNYAVKEKSRDKDENVIYEATLIVKIKHKKNIANTRIIQIQNIDDIILENVE